MNTILLVDDEPAMIKMLKWRLETTGFKVISAISGLEALHTIQQTPVDFVITDVRMPAMDGLTLIKKIKKVLNNIPCLVMSGHGDIDMTGQAKEVGACGYIHKPIKFEELEKIIQQNLAESSHAPGLVH